ELLAVQFAVKVFAKELRNLRVCVQVDNQGAVSILKKGSPMPKLQEVAEDVFDFMESLGSELDPVWVPRENNCLADEASRLLDRDDWGIRPEVFDMCVRRWGQPTVDAFANARNRKCPRFWSKFADIDTCGVDALASSWEGEFVWAVPPPTRIAEVVDLVVRQGARAILGIPVWPSHLFFPALWDGRAWRDFVRDVLCFPPNSEIFTPSTFESSVFNEPSSTFPFCFLLLDAAL
uniref:RNase H domain-containing protein n=1 Tax=Steinernema glaseri TaxID=37863 RepID=A0A1I7YVY0_9BILA